MFACSLRIIYTSTVRKLVFYGNLSLQNRLHCIFELSHCFFDILVQRIIEIIAMKLTGSLTLEYRMCSSRTENIYQANSNLQFTAQIKFKNYGFYIVCHGFINLNLLGTNSFPFVFNIKK